MQRRLAFYLLIMVCLSACATTQVMSKNTRAKVAGANTVLNAIASETERFYTDAETVRQEVRTLYDHPGWPEMKEIIDAMASDAEEKDAPMSEAQVLEATRNWSRKWNEPWHAMFSRYLTLVKRCSALELQRITLQSKILDAQAKFLGAAVSEYAENRYDQGRSLEEIVEILGNSAGELDSYTVDAMGLYP